MNKLPWYKKLIGYILPIVTTYHESEHHPNLKVKYFQGQWQLESDDALYSDGWRYAPFRLAYDFLYKKKQLLPINNFLLLGAGLGSALLRLQKVYKAYPTATLVEYDSDIIELGNIYSNLNEKENVQFIHAEALEFITHCKQQFDFIGIDIFEGLSNSDLIDNPFFWDAIFNIAQPEARIVFNAIFLRKIPRDKFEAQIQKAFTFDRLERPPNYIYILRPKK